MLVWFTGNSSFLTYMATGFYSDNGTPPTRVFAGSAYQVQVINAVTNAPLW